MQPSGDAEDPDMSDERDRISAEIMNRVISDRVSIDEAADRVAHEYR